MCSYKFCVYVHTYVKKRARKSWILWLQMYSEIKQKDTSKKITEVNSRG